MFKCTGGKVYSLSLTSLIDSNSQAIEALRVNNIMDRDFKLPMPSCHGLILISHLKVKVERPWSLWNPSTGEWLELPRIDHSYTYCSTGLGYDGATDDYKVVMVSSPGWVCYNNYRDIRTFVYSLKSKQWRRIDDFHNFYMPEHPGVYVNGELHWIACAHEDGVDVCCTISFHLTTEVFRKIPLPSFAHKYIRTCPFLRLDALAGCLFLTYYHGVNHFSIWILKDCGKGDMWNQMITLHDELELTKTFIRPVAYMKSEQQILLEYSHYKFLWFDMVKNIKRIISIGQGIQKRYYSQLFPESLTHLNAFKGTPKRKRKRTYNRLNVKLELQTSCVPS